MTTDNGPGIRCGQCGALPDEPHGEECPEWETGPVWPGTTADDQEG